MDGWPEYTPKGTTSKPSGVPPFVYFEPNSYSYTLQPFGQVDATYPGFFIVPNGNSPYNPPQSSVQPALLGLVLSSAFKPNPHTNINYPVQMAADWGFAVPYANSFNLSSGAVTAWNPKKFQIIAPGLDCEYGGSVYELAGEGRGYTPVVPQTATQTAPPFQSITNGDNDNLTNFMDSKIEDYSP